MNFDMVITRRVSFTIREGEGFTIARPIQRGTNGTLSGREMRNIVFRETRSLSGDAVNVARRNIAHAVMNGDEESGAGRPITAPTTAANPAPGERTAYEASGRMVLRAHAERSLGHDPTRGATHFNMRSTDSTANFQGARITTQSGPLDNSYPTRVLPESGIYVNTYREPD